jgi:hypothetical protein
VDGAQALAMRSRRSVAPSSARAAATARTRRYPAAPAETCIDCLIRQGNHIHLIGEADDRRALARGVQGLSIRIARGVTASPAAPASSSATATTCASSPARARCATPVGELLRRLEIPARRWLLTTGWRRHGLISFEESPSTPG